MDFFNIIQLFINVLKKSGDLFEGIQKLYIATQGIIYYNT
jgi:hypothetical protein